jgi:branched-chain amino acid transport system permease protein
MADVERQPSVSLQASWSSPDRKRWLGWIAGAAVLLLIPVITREPYHITICVNLFITIMLTLSMNFVVGISGQWSFAHAAFFGAGAYIPAILATRFGVSPWLGLPLAISAVLILATIIGMPIVRLRGYYLAVCTLALGFLAEVIVRQGADVTGGGYGIQRIPALEWFGTPLRGAAYYPVAVCGVMLTGILFSNLTHSPLGRAIMAARDNPLAASAMGINVAQSKLIAFVLAAAIAAVAGWLHAFYFLGLDPSLLSTDSAFLWIFMVFIGGVGHTPGVVLGTVLLVLAPEIIGFAAQGQVLGLGILMLIVALFAPRGLGGVLDVALASLSTRKGIRW